MGVHVCKFACLYVCMYVCEYVCMYVCMYVCYVCMYICYTASLNYEKAVTVAGGSNTFSCVVTSAMSVAIAWLFNGTDISRRNIPSVTTYIVPGVGESVGVLTFSNINLLYNGTSVQCQALLSGERGDVSNEFILLVQGSIISFHKFSIIMQIFSCVFPKRLNKICFWHACKY